MKTSSRGLNPYKPVELISRSRRATLLFAFTSLLIVTAGCATTRQISSLYPPIMELDELKRDYQKIAIIEFSSERFGNVAVITSEDYDRAISELRERAQSVGADAVILPEVRSESDTSLFFPSSRILAKGLAIKFR